MYAKLKQLTELLTTGVANLCHKYMCLNLSVQTVNTRVSQGSLSCPPLVNIFTITNSISQLGNKNVLLLIMMFMRKTINFLMLQLRLCRPSFVVLKNEIIPNKD